MKASIKLNGNSMYPLIRDLDDVEVQFFDKPIKATSRDHGKVVLLKDQDEWLVHRVICDNQRIMTKGDWSIALDEASLPIWGEVIGINGKKNYLLESHKIAQLSLVLHSKTPRWVRQWSRLKILFIILFNKRKRVL